MAIIPANEKVFMVSNGTNTTYGGSAALQAMNQWYTMQDISDSVGAVVLPYKVYTALISQAGEGDPEVIVLENTIGEIEWGRKVTGNYSAELVDAFTVNKTAFFISGLDGNSGGGGGSPLGPGTSIVFANKDRVDLFVTDSSGTLVDVYLTKYPIEIRVYN